MFVMAFVGVFGGVLCLGVDLSSFGVFSGYILLPSLLSRGHTDAEIFGRAGKIHPRAEIALPHVHAAPKCCTPAEICT